MYSAFFQTNQNDTEVMLTLSHSETKEEAQADFIQTVAIFELQDPHNLTILMNDEGRHRVEQLKAELGVTK
jgi:hypothetical protein